MSSARRMRRVVGEVNEELYSTPEDALATAEALGLGRYILAATFGNVHGVYRPDQTNPAPLEPASPCAGRHAR
jgi:fructose/tagatose bisphosphate aldolase